MKKTVTFGSRPFILKIYLLVSIGLGLININTVRTQVTGKVSVDFDANGIQTDSLPFKPGIRDVQIRLAVSRK